MVENKPEEAKQPEETKVEETKLVHLMPGILLISKIVTMTMNRIEEQG